MTLSRARVLVCAAVAASLVALAPVGARLALGDDAKSDAHTLPENASVPDPAEPAGEHQEPVVAPFTTPAAAADARGCPNGWSRFDNPALHYRICLPEGWGFTDFSRPEPLTEIPSRMLENLHVLSPEGFPWRPGDAPFEVIERGSVVNIELNLLEPDVASVIECEPAAPVAVAKATFLTCEQAYDELGLPAEVGRVRALKVIAPLQRTPLRLHPLFDPTGARLQVIVRSALSTGKEANLAWRIVQSICAL